MELFRLEMRKKFGVVVNYNYDKTGVPNGFIVIDPQSKSVWKGEELVGFIRASPPYLSQGVFVMNVESIGGRAPKYAVRELDKNDVAAYKNGEMLLEELVLKYYHKEVREALERSFHSTCDEKGTGLGLPTFTLPLSLSGINELFCEMSDTANSIVDNSLGNGFQPVGSGITAGSGKSLGKRRKKRRGDDSDEGLSSGMHY